MPVLEELRPLLRVEEPPDPTVFLARGGPDSIASLRMAAFRTARRFCLDGEPLLGISVAATLDVPLDELVSRAPLLRFEHVYAPTVARLQGFQLLPTFGRPHFTVRLQRADDPELRELLAVLGPLQANPGYAKRTGGLCPLTACEGKGGAGMYRVDISADLNDDDGSGYLWAFLDEARDPSLVKAGAVLVAGSEDAAAMCEVTRLESADDGDTIVHLRVLPGMVEDYLGAAGRALVS